MRLQLFNYKLPQELIAQNPPKKRSDARLMVVHRDTGLIEHKKFTDIIDYVDPEDVFMVNDSYMLNNLIFGQKQNSSVQICVYLLREVDIDNYIWDIEADPARKVRVGNKLYFKDLDAIGEIIDNTSVRGRMIKFITNKSTEEFRKDIVNKGLTRLPKYIKRFPNADDLKYTKSFFAKKTGSINHVISGLHFDEKLVLQMKLKGIHIESLTYNINDFPTNKFSTKTVNNCKRIPEFFNIDSDVIDLINKRKANGSKIFATGYSTLMGLENAYNPALEKLSDVNEIVLKTVFNRNDFNVCDGYLTNFYEPGSMFLIVDTAFCGEELLTKAYEEAIKEKYNFLLFGDSLLII